MSPRRVRERERGHAMSRLPTALGDVRAVFHRFKTTKRPLSDVVSAMCANTKSAYTDDQALLHLHLLLEHAPQFLKLEGDLGKEVLSIDKGCNVQAIKEMLKEIADSRPKVEVTDAAVEERLSVLDTFNL